MGKKKSAGGGRVHLSATQGRALVEQWRRSGLSIAAYCRSHGVREHVLRYRLSREETPSPSAAAQGEFFVVSASAKDSAGAPVRGDNRAGAVIVVLPAVTPDELVLTLRGLLNEARA